MLHTIHQFFEACHPFGYPLLACSVLLLTAIFYQWHIRRKTELNDSVWRLCLQLIGRGATQRDKALANLKENATKHPILNIAIFIAENKEMESLPAVVESKLRLFIEKSRTGMGLVSIITNIAPMLGILGTAWGLVDIFGVFGTPGAQEGIALGISKALYTTIFGLAIAVPGIIAQTCFERRLERTATHIDELFTELLAHRNEI